MYHDPTRFTFTAALEQNWEAIRDEFHSVGREALVAWPEKFLYDRGWDVLGLFFNRAKLRDNCARCPVTTQLVESIPGMTTAGFSLLKPGTHIRPHVGYTPAVLRCHLGLVVPPGCEMRVGTETRGWREGGALVFDDTVEHEVWHRGESERVILLVDFRKSFHREALTIPSTPRTATT